VAESPPSLSLLRLRYRSRFISLSSPSSRYRLHHLAIVSIVSLSSPSSRYRLHRLAIASIVSSSSSYRYRLVFAIVSTSSLLSLGSPYPIATDLEAFATVRYWQPDTFHQHNWSVLEPSRSLLRPLVRSPKERASQRMKTELAMLDFCPGTK